MIYAFDEADSDLTLMPMASRRALDATGIKLSLASYQTLAVVDRRELARLGAAQQVDSQAVRDLAARATGPAAAASEVRVEPPDMPAALPAALGAGRTLDEARWQRLSALDRYVLDKLHRANKTERLHAAYDEIVARVG